MYQTIKTNGIAEDGKTTEVAEILPRSVRLKGEGEVTEIPNDFVFVFAGGDPPIGLLNRIGVQLGGPAAATA